MSKMRVTTMLDTRATRKHEGIRVQQILETLNFFINMNFKNIRLSQIYMTTAAKNQCFYKL